jgi:AcrR family transcriptional regulator
MKNSRVDVAGIRRRQIVEAAVAVIAEQGLPKLSLSEIEEKAGMSRGQLTYYFPTKEDILLAVFDHLLALMKERVQAGDAPNPCKVQGSGWDRLRYFLTMVMLQPMQQAEEFHSLQYTFLSQIGHRADFRERLASLYGEWRAHMAADIAGDLSRRPARDGARHVSPSTFATLVQAILHGLGMQRAADPDAYDRQEMLDLCLDLLGSYLQPRPADNGHAPTADGDVPHDPPRKPEPAPDSQRRRRRPRPTTPPVKNE